MDDYPSVIEPLRSVRRMADDGEQADKDAVFSELETAASRLRKKARDNNLESVLQKENAPAPETIRENYDTIFDEDGGFNEYQFRKLENKMANIDTLVDDLIAAREHGF